jgi:cysteine-rich repeat protein
MRDAIARAVVLFTGAGGLAACGVEVAGDGGVFGTTLPATEDGAGTGDSTVTITTGIEGGSQTEGSGATGATDGAGTTAGVDDTGAGSTGSDAGTSGGDSTGGGSTGGTTSGSSSDGAVAECGNGALDLGEECDDGDADDSDDCLSTCQLASCGDGELHAGYEECDDGNVDDTDDCVDNCVAATCGDGHVLAGVEECDDGNMSNTDACPSCQDAACGDGFVWLGNEQCDGGNGCNPDCTIVAGSTRTVFVSSQLYTGDMGGLVGADALCQGLATAAGLPGVYMAWLSDGVDNPTTRFNQSAVPYVLVTGEQVADNWADLVDGSLDTAIDTTETGGAVPIGNTSCNGGGFPTVWANVTQTGGTANAGHCVAWDDANGQAAGWGLASDTTGWWTEWCSGGGAVCVWTSPIYCFQQ